MKQWSLFPFSSTSRRIGQGRRLQRQYRLLLLLLLMSMLFGASASNVLAVAPPPGLLAQHSHSAIRSVNLDTAPYRYEPLLQADKRLSASFIRLMQILRRHGSAEAASFAKAHLLLTPDQQVGFSLLLDTPDEGVRADLSNRLVALGAKMTPSAGRRLALIIPLSTLQASLDRSRLGFLDNLTALPHLAAVRISQSFVLTDERPGSRLLTQLALDHDPVLSEGVHRMGADRWQKAGFTGKGVKIGLLDLGFDGYQKLLGTGLPRSIVIKAFNRSGDITGPNENHGSAVAEIVHNVAPEAQIYAAVIDTRDSWQPAVNWLVSQGVKVISSSTGGLIGPRDDSGDEERAIDQLRSRGILYFNASGNFARGHYGGPFKATSDGFTTFTPTGTTFLHISRYAQSGFTVLLQWNDWQSTSQILDLYLTDKNGAILDQSLNRRDGDTTEPVQAIQVDNPDSTLDYFIAVKGVTVTHPLHLDIFLLNAELETPVAAGSLVIPADARKAVDVGAADVSTDKLESFSSQGPTEDGRPKPELVAPDGTSGQVFGPRNFYGTSASTPHAAAVAALIFAAFPGIGADGVVQFMERNALHQGAYPNNSTGYGRVQLPSPPRKR